jgi:hypothetical protein
VTSCSAPVVDFRRMVFWGPEVEWHERDVVVPAFRQWPNSSAIDVREEIVECDSRFGERLDEWLLDLGEDHAKHPVAKRRA